jgi:hypothetical protein
VKYFCVEINLSKIRHQGIRRDQSALPLCSLVTEVRKVIADYVTPGLDEHGWYEGPAGLPRRSRVWNAYGKITAVLEDGALTSVAFLL